MANQKVRLEKYVDGEWWKYGDYDISENSQLKALVEAAFLHGTHEISVRVRELKENDV